jgi:arginase
MHFARPSEADNSGAIMIPRVALIQLPYDCGQLNARMGAGPAALIARGLADELRTSCEVEILEIHLPDGFYTEGSALVELQRRATIAAREAIARGARPILLSGNCGPAALSATAALDSATSGVVWFDAHADFNTPETSPSGFLDGMGLAILTGQCWRNLAARFENFTPTPEERIVQIGVRHVDVEERSLLESTRITRIASHELDRLPTALNQLTRGTRELYLHLDADVLDISEGSANSYACAGGLTRQDLSQALELIRSHAEIGAASITSYDPASDADGRIAQTLNRIFPLLAT